MSLWDRLVERAADAVVGPKGATEKELREEFEAIRKAQEEADKKDGKQ